MRLITPVAALFGLSWGAPVSNAPQAEHPAIASLSFTSQQFGIVVTELQKYNGDPYAADQIIHHAQETLKSLEVAINDIRKGPTFDIWTVLSVVSPLTSLNVEVHQMANVLKTKKQTADKAQIGPVVFNVLKQTHRDATQLAAAIVEKLPVGVSALAKILSDEIVSTIATVRDLYRPASDVTIIIADPNRPVSGGYSIQPSGGQGGPYPQGPYPQGPYPQGPYPQQPQNPQNGFRPGQPSQLGQQGPQGPYSPQKQQQGPPSPW